MPFPRDRSALVSIHDVSPGSLAGVERIVEQFCSAGIQPVTLLVIPGLDWSASGIDALRRLEGQGCQLAGHGWVHRCGPQRTWYHRLHSLALSRDVAEHLSLDHDGILSLMRDCYRWFAQAGLGPPELYVPPAWALGAVPLTALRDLPFRYYEVASGVYDARLDAFHRLPLLGYEADTSVRSVLLRGFNATTKLAAAWLRRPIRVAIHPQDLQLRLAAALARDLRQIRRAIGYGVLGAAAADAREVRESARRQDSRRCASSASLSSQVDEQTAELRRSDHI